MNLTSKRMLKFVTGLAGACALSATATQFQADSFENDPGDDYPATNGLPVVYYKGVADEILTDVIVTTNWFAADGDASKIVAADAGNQGYAASPRPMAGAVSNLVLNLETEGQTLTRPVAGAPMDFINGTAVYVDTLIKFTPSEDDPVIEDANVKAAVFVNVQSNLVVYHGVLGGDPTNTVTSLPINPEQWYRLTILLDSLDNASGFFTVYLDGTEIVTASGWTPEETQPGPWFPSASVNGTLNAVAFQGTGMVDELVIADSVTLAFEAGLLLTLSFNDALLDVTINSVAVTNNQPIASGATLDINAIDWYQINGVTGDGITYGGTTGALVNTSSGIVTADVAGRTATIDVSQYTGTIPTGLPAPYTTVPADKLAAWAVANNKTEAEVIANAAGWLDDYLCNVAPDTNPQLVITSIVVDNTAGIATITVGSTGNAVDFDSINGTLVVYTADTVAGLAANPVPVGEFVVTLQLNQTATIEVDLPGNNFIQAVIQ